VIFNQQKIIFFTNFFCLLLFDGTFTSFFKDKNHKEVINSKNKDFHTIFA